VALDQGHTRSANVLVSIGTRYIFDNLSPTRPSGVHVLCMLCMRPVTPTEYKPQSSVLKWLPVLLLCQLRIHGFSEDPKPFINLFLGDRGKCHPEAWALQVRWRRTLLLLLCRESVPHAEEAPRDDHSTTCQRFLHDPLCISQPTACHAHPHEHACTAGHAACTA
jgi:hypothetical protein